MPGEVIDALKELARARGVRYTTLVRDMLEQGLRDADRSDDQELSQINVRLARIEQAMADQERRQKRAMRSVASARNTTRVYRRQPTKGVRKQSPSRKNSC